jgi:hypothetical protein
MDDDPPRALDVESGSELPSYQKSFSARSNGAFESDQQMGDLETSINRE